MKLLFSRDNEVCYCESSLLHFLEMLHSLKLVFFFLQSYLLFKRINLVTRYLIIRHVNLRVSLLKTRARRGKYTDGTLSDKCSWEHKFLNKHFINIILTFNSMSFN